MLNSCSLSDYGTMYERSVCGSLITRYVDESPGEGSRDVTDNLDVVDWRQSLDVSVLKDRLAVKQKGKRLTTALRLVGISEDTRQPQVSPSALTTNA